MRFRLLCTTLLAVPLPTGLAAPARQDVVQKTALVTVVAEARGPVANLGPRDLVVREDGATRDVLDVRPATEPIFIALLIDTIRPPAGVASRLLRPRTIAGGSRRLFRSSRAAIRTRR